MKSLVSNKILKYLDDEPEQRNPNHWTIWDVRIASWCNTTKLPSVQYVAL